MKFKGRGQSTISKPTTDSFDELMHINDIDGIRQD
jgi:hypothetical protein